MPESTSNSPLNLGGHSFTQAETAQLMVGMNMTDRYLMPPKMLGPKKPDDAAGGFLQKDAYKALGLSPNQEIRDQLGGPKGYDYKVFASKTDPRSFYLGMLPEHPGQAANWLKFTGKPEVNLAKTEPPSAAQIQKTQAAMAKAAQYGDLGSSPSETTLGRLYSVLNNYAVDTAHLETALTTGNRKLLGTDMVRIYKDGKLHTFSDDVVNASLPITKNQDGSTATAEQQEMNKLRNEMMSDNLHATILSELLLNQKIGTLNGEYYKNPDAVANEVNTKLLKLHTLRKTLNINPLEPLYFSEQQQEQFIHAGQSYHRDEIIRADVLELFAELVTPEKPLTPPEFTWGNRVEFLPDGGEAFQERLLQIDALIAQAQAGKAVTYDYTVWKHYANKPIDTHELGKKLAAKLLELANAGGNIHMTVDRTVALRDPGVIVSSNGKIVGGVLAPLANHPNVKLRLFNNDERGTPGDANHSKSAVANGYTAEASAIVGGRNVHGDYFYGWTDTEFSIQGKLAQSIQRAQDDMWIQQATLHKDPNSLRKIPEYQEPAKLGNVIGLATHEMPGPYSHFNGLIGVLASLEMSGFECTMVQAYVLPPIPNAKIDPTLEAIKRAVMQGKVVNIVTNSPQTIDTPQISSAIVKYAAHLLDEINQLPQPKGSLRIYMKRKWEGKGGGTLHAKLCFDKYWYVCDTSNNLHDNGFLQHEGQRYYLDDELNEAVRAWCNQLMTQCDVYTISDKLKVLANAIDNASISNPALNTLMNLFPYQL